MSKLRVLGAAMLATGLAVGAMTVPATAINGGAHIVIGHGIPGVAVDICVNDGSGQVEVKSDFKYGKHFKATLPAGSYAFITRLASPGVCKGALVIKATIELDGTEDLSIIATKTKGVPNYQAFDHSADYVDPIVAQLPAVVSVKHAAMIGRADAFVDILLNDKSASAPPTVEGVPKGAAASFPWFFSDAKFSVAKTGTSKILGTTPYWELREGYVNHVVAVGAKKNLRFIRYRTPLPLFN